MFAWLSLLLPLVRARSTIGKSSIFLSESQSCTATRHAAAMFDCVLLRVLDSQRLM
jgi:hypothetical protein